MHSPALQGPVQPLNEAIFAAHKTVQSGEYARGVAAAQEVVKTEVVTAQDVYNAACTFSTAIPKVNADDALTDAEKKSRSEDYSLQAVRYLRRAVETGFTDDEQYRSDSDLDILRDREDFKEMMDLIPQSKIVESIWIYTY